MPILILQAPRVCYYHPTSRLSAHPKPACLLFHFLTFCTIFCPIGFTSSLYRLDFDANLYFLSTAHLRARDQRYRERFVAIAEMKMLQDELRVCKAKNTVNAPRLCRPLAMEYMRRLKCPLYVCDKEVRPCL